jgi:hypothetical protein
LKSDTLLLQAEGPPPAGGKEIGLLWRTTVKKIMFYAGLRNSIIIELGIGFNIAFSNSIGIGIEIGIAKKSRPVL